MILEETFSLWPLSILWILKDGYLPTLDGKWMRWEGEGKSWFEEEHAQRAVVEKGRLL